MNTHEIIKKLIGDIRPIGESNTDRQRFSNLRETCELVEALLYDIDDMIHLNKNEHQASVKECVKYAQNFMQKTIQEMTPSRRG